MTATPTTDAAAEAAIDAACRTLHLPTIRTEAGPAAEAAARDKITHRGYLAELLAAETDARTQRRQLRRINDAKFPRHKTLTAFDTTHSPVDPALLGVLATGRWIEEAQPVVLIGDSGTGKTHLLIALGMAACEQGRSVRYITAANLVNELAEAADDHTLSRLIGRYGRVDLLCLDELGYLTLDPRGAELLFQVITEREERASIAVATNAPFSEWGRTFTDPRLAAAVVDRLTFNAHLITTGTDSHRLRTTRTAKT